MHKSSVRVVENSALFNTTNITSQITLQKMDQPSDQPQWSKNVSRIVGPGLIATNITGLGNS